MNAEQSMLIDEQRKEIAELTRSRDNQRRMLTKFAEENGKLKSENERITATDAISCTLYKYGFFAGLLSWSIYIGYNLTL